jgi:hypothetical protein
MRVVEGCACGRISAEAVIGVVLTALPGVVGERLGDVRWMLMAHENAQLDASSRNNMTGRSAPTKAQR